MRQQHGECFERREPTMGTAQPAGMANRRPFIPDRAAIKRAEWARRGIIGAPFIKPALWLVVWFVMLCLCQKAAEASGVRDITALTVALEAIGTLLMLVIAFWRVAFALGGWIIGLVIALAIIKGAFLIVFGL